MPRRLVLHIGFYKTGTTALQDQLAASAPALADRGVLYPRSGRPAPGHSNHSGLAFQELHVTGSHLPYWYRNGPEFAAYKEGSVASARAAIAEEIADSTADTVIVSSEEFVRFGSRQGVPAEQARDMIGALGLEHTTIICYVRRPDRYLESWYNQLVKLAVPLARLSVSMGEEPAPGHRYYASEHTDFDRMISYWVDGVGCDDLVVRDYDHLYNGTIFDDFSAAVGLPPLGPVVIPDIAANPRIDNNFIEYVRVWSLFRPRQDHSALHAVLAEMADLAHLPPLFDVYLLDPRARHRLHEYCTPVNDRLGELAGRTKGFFADIDDMLVVADDAVSDLEAFEFWSPYIDIAVRARGIT